MQLLTFWKFVVITIATHGAGAPAATLIKSGAINKIGAMKALAHGLSRATIAKVRYGIANCHTYKN